MVELALLSLVMVAALMFFVTLFWRSFWTSFKSPFFEGEVWRTAAMCIATGAGLTFAVRAAWQTFAIVCSQSLGSGVANLGIAVLYTAAGILGFGSAWYFHRRFAGERVRHLAGGCTRAEFVAECLRRVERQLAKPTVDLNRVWHLAFAAAPSCDVLVHAPCAAPEEVRRGLRVNFNGIGSVLMALQSAVSDFGSKRVHPPLKPGESFGHGPEELKLQEFVIVGDGCNVVKCVPVDGDSAIGPEQEVPMEHLPCEVRLRPGSRFYAVRYGAAWRGYLPLPPSAYRANRDRWNQKRRARVAVAA